ncbi:MAG: hypothetical protein IT282_04775 [Bacteroidetes bacterium]|nr:hypothetical protein [Bacteroidota bacterium]
MERYAEDENGQELFEDLSWLVEHPLDLNAAGRADLLRIPGVTASDADFVVRFRRRVGGISSLDQLRRAGSDGTRLSFLLSPFIRIRTSHRASLRTRSRWRWNPGGGVAGARGHPPGPASDELHRLEAHLWESVMCGVSFDRDAGERYGNAFYSGFVRVTDGLGFDDLIIGDYRARGGMNLALGSPGSAFGSGMRASGPGPDTRIEPFHGSAESSVLRGIAGTRLLRFQAGTLRLSGLFSRTPLSASLDSCGNVTSIASASAFTTEDALGRQHNTHETTLAMRAVFSARVAFSLGVTVLRTKLSRPRLEDKPFDPSRSTGVLALDGSIARGPVSLWGECSWSATGAAIAGRCQWALDGRTSLTCAAWYFGPGYWNPRAGGSSGSGDARNHGGACLSWICVISGRTTLTGYIEHYRRPWRTAFDPMPPSGSEIAIGVTSRVVPRVTVEARIASSRKEGAYTKGTTSSIPDREMMFDLRNRIRCGLEVGLGPLGGLRSRVDWVQVQVPGDGKTETGWMFLQELRIAWPGLPRVNARLSLYQTDSYASRLYAQERDVEGAYANPPCYGSGMRWYVVVRQSVVAGFALSAKIAASTNMNGAFTLPSSSTVSVQVDFQTNPD